MSVYMIADIKVTDPAWIPGYAEFGPPPRSQAWWASYLARSGNVKTLEGKPPDTTLIALIEFPSPDALDAFLDDPDYAPARHGATGRQREPLPDDRQFGSCRDNPVPAQGLTSRA